MDDATYTFGINSKYKISLESMDYALLPIDKLIDKYHSKETCIKLRIFDVENEDKIITKDETDVLQSYFEYEIEGILKYSEKQKESFDYHLNATDNSNNKTKHCYICRVNIPAEHYRTHVSSNFHILNLKIVQDSVNRLNESMIYDLNNTHHDMTTELGMTTADHDLPVKHASKIANNKNSNTPLFCTTCNETYVSPFHINSQKHVINSTKLKLLENFTNVYLDKNFDYTSACKSKEIPKCGTNSHVQQLKNLLFKENVQPQNNTQKINEQPMISSQNQFNFQLQKNVQPMIEVQSHKNSGPPSQKKVQLIKKVQPDKKLQLDKNAVPCKNTAISVKNVQPQKKLQLQNKTQNNIQVSSKKMQSQNNAQPQKNPPNTKKSFGQEFAEICPTLNLSNSLDVWWDASLLCSDNYHKTAPRAQDNNLLQMVTQLNSNQEDESEFGKIVGTAKITKEPKGYFCHHCQVYVPRNLKNLSEHLKGKPHKSK